MPREGCNVFNFQFQHKTEEACFKQYTSVVGALSLF